MSQNDSVVLGATYGKNPRAEEYECVVPGCDEQAWTEYEPSCPKHKIRMKPAN